MAMSPLLLDVAMVPLRKERVKYSAKRRGVGTMVRM